MINKNENRDIFNEIQEDRLNKLTDNDFDKQKSENFIIYAPNNIYLNILKCGNCIVKILKDNALNHFVANSKKNIFTLLTRTIRKVEKDENYYRIANIFNKNENLYVLGNEYKINVDEIFFIINMRTNYRILKNLFPNEIPDTKFALVDIEGFGKSEFAIFQRYIDGKNLFGLYHHDEHEFCMTLRQPNIKSKIENFINCKYIDLNIRNFIIDNNNNIFYVDIKPTYLSYINANEKNKDSLIKYMKDFK